MFEVNLSARPKSSAQIPRKRTLPNVAIGNYLPSTDQKSLIIRKELSNKNIIVVQPIKKQNATPRIRSANKSRFSSKQNAQQLNTSKNQSKIQLNHSNASIRLSMIRSEQITSKKQVKEIKYKGNQQTRKSAVFCGKDSTVKYNLNIVKKIFTPNQESIHFSNVSKDSNDTKIKSIKQPLNRQSSFKGSYSKGNSFALKGDSEQEKFIEKIINNRINRSKQKIEMRVDQSIKSINDNSLQKNKAGVTLSVRKRLKKKTATQTSLKSINQTSNKCVAQHDYSKEASFSKQQDQFCGIDLVTSKRLDTPKQKQKKCVMKETSKKPFFNQIEGQARIKKSLQKNSWRVSKFKQAQSTQKVKQQNIKQKPEFCKQAQNIAKDLAKRIKENAVQKKSRIEVKKGSYFIDFLK